MEKAGTWNVGTIVWVAFGVLLLWGLAAALWDWLLDLPATVAERRAERLRTPPRSMEPVGATEQAHEDDRPNPWAETGFGPLGDPKIWCGTCAEAAKEHHRAD